MKSTILTCLLLFAAASVRGQSVKLSSAPGSSMARLITYVAPVYPDTAEAGKFHSPLFTARLGVDGRLHDFIPLGANDDFATAAIRAASQWVYEPYSVNGQPIERDTVVSVVFRSQGHHTQFDKPIRVSETMIARLIEHKVKPRYPSADVSGSVVLSAVLGRDGKVTALQAISGPKALYPAALEAARQWTYKPYLLDGEPTEIQTEITINFDR